MVNKGKAYELGSGAKLFVSVSEYEKVMDLHDALVDALRDGGGAGALDVAQVQRAIEAAQKKRQHAAAGVEAQLPDDGSGDAGLNVIVDRVLAVAGSKRVKAAIFACSLKAVYMPDGTEASSVTFDPAVPGYGVFDNPKCLAQARADFYDICKAIVEENLRPFGQALFSMFRGLVENSADSPSSPTAKG